ncbi:uncharacterized protein [Centruroides vittatus]|uniref:uncharacterized protein n=1 Tax=Centruroides vittatus TaxID=120091 RepID=UPI00350FF9CA
MAVREVLCLVDLLGRKLNTGNENSRDVERRVEAFLEVNPGKIHFPYPHPYDEENMRYRFMNDGYNKCVMPAKSLLLKHFTMHDSRSLIQANIIKLLVFVRSTDYVPESLPEDDENHIRLKKMIMDLKVSRAAAGITSEKSLDAMKMMLLTDPASRIKLRDSSRAYLKKVFLCNLSTVSKVDVATLGCLMTSVDLQGFTQNDYLGSHFPAFTILLMQILEADAYLSQLSPEYLFDSRLLLAEWH